MNIHINFDEMLNNHNFRFNNNPQQPIKQHTFQPKAGMLPILADFTVIESKVITEGTEQNENKA